MDLILCHTTADFDTVGAAVGLARLQPGARIVLTGGCHPPVRDFLALHRDEYPLIERRSVNPEQIRSITVVDTLWRDRLGKAAEWLDLPDITITLYDHHLGENGDIPASQTHIEAVGATSTLIVEQLRVQQMNLSVAEATAMALGIHVDTGSLTYDHTTVRDAVALAWLMERGASLRAIAEYVEPGLSTEMQDILALALEKLNTETIQGYTIAWVLLPVAAYLPGLSNIAARVMTLTEADVLLLAVRYPAGEEERLTVIGRCRSSAGATSTAEINLSELFKPLGGGGHPRAAALTLRGIDPQETLEQLLAQLRSQLPHPPTARELMSSPVRTIRPETTIAEAQRILLRYGHSGLSVVDAQGHLVGVISRRDLDIALHHGFSHAPVKGYMTTLLKTIAPETTLPEIEDLMVTYDIGRLPVLEDSQSNQTGDPSKQTGGQTGGQLVGIVTRTDVLRQLHQEKLRGNGQRTIAQGIDSEVRDQSGKLKRGSCVLPEFGHELLRDRLPLPLRNVLQIAAQQAEQRGWQLYLVGGAVRDLLLAQPGEKLVNIDLDLVVDGCHQAAEQAAGVELARSLQETYPQARLQVHGRFQTAALLWHHDPLLDSLWLDIATARTEFYPYPAANPEVEASSIRQDLYRRDFTINALAIRLTPPRSGEMLDFFGGLLDLEAKQIRVLHANSFIEDPTRIFRAVRFAVRLGFQLDPQTEGYIRHAIASGIYHRIQSEMEKTPALQTRLKQELKYILQAPYWQRAIRLLADLGAMTCIHPSLKLTVGKAPPTDRPEEIPQDRLWWRLRLVDRWLKRFDTAETVPHWQVLLELILAHLEQADRVSVAEHFQLPAESVDRLRQFDQTQQDVKMALQSDRRPSQFTQLFRQYDLPLLILLAVFGPRYLRQFIWKYLTCWATIKAPLDGDDLKALGYKPGRQFKVILEALLAATLDGEVGDRAEAEAFVADRFPNAEA